MQPFLLNGAWLREGAVVPVLSPYDGRELAQVHHAEPKHLEQALQVVSAASRSFHASGYANLNGTAYDDAARGSILQRVSAGIREDLEGFARRISDEAGKPIKAARAEAERAVFTFALAADLARSFGAERESPVPMPDGRIHPGRIRRFPLGPIAAITPFNFPLNLVAHKLAPAIAAGNTVVLKPAPQTPLSAFRLAELLLASGLPPAALHVLPMSNETAATLVRDDRCNMLSFTGSASVGWQLKQQAGKKRVVLELGGNAAVIVHEDADILLAAERCAAGGFGYAGQSCISVQRIFAHRSIFHRFAHLLVGAVHSLKCGDPAAEHTDVGPLIRESDAVRVEQWIHEAVAQGARLVCGGKRNGSMIDPTVLMGTRAEQRVNCEEIFGPLVTLEPYDDFSEALARANDSRYGLQAGVFTADETLIAQAFTQLEVGGVIVNEVPTFRSDAMPYGGMKDSGLGREGVKWAMEEMSELKVMVRIR